MSNPSTMHFVDHGTGGGPEVLTPGTCATPTPKQGEVLVKVAFAGVNRPDCLQRSGRYPPPPGASSIVGLEVSGEVERLGWFKLEVVVVAALVQAQGLLPRSLLTGLMSLDEYY